MIPWSHLDTAQVPGGGELRLMRRGAEFSIMFGQTELMNSRLSGSEQALATIACERIRARERPRILIGGLGMGFTLRAALAVRHPWAAGVSYGTDATAGAWIERDYSVVRVGMDVVRRTLPGGQTTLEAVARLGISF